MSKVITAGVLIAAALVGLVVLTAPTGPTYVAVTTPAPVVVAPPAPAQVVYDPNADHVTDLVYMPRIIAEDSGQRPYNP